MCCSSTTLLTMAGHGVVLLTQLLLLLLLLCRLKVEGFWRIPRIGRSRHVQQQCVFNGRFYQNGKTVVSISEACADVVCQGTKVGLQPQQEPCSCLLPTPEGGDEGKQVQIGQNPAISYRRLWTTHCYYNRKVKNVGEVVANLSSNCIYISCQRFRLKAVLKTFLMPNCHCQDGQQPAEELTTESTPGPLSNISHIPHQSKSHVFQPLKPIISGVLRSFHRSKWTETPTASATTKPRHHQGPRLFNLFGFSHVKSSLLRPQKQISFNLSKTIMFQSVNPNSVNTGNPLFFRLSQLNQTAPFTASISLKKAASCLLYNPPTSHPEAPSTSHPVEQVAPRQMEMATFQSTQSTNAHPTDLETIQPRTSTILHPTEPATSHPTEPPSPHPTEPPNPHPTEQPYPHPTEQPYPHPTKPSTPQPTEPLNPYPTKLPIPYPTKPPIPHPIEPSTQHPTEPPTQHPTEPPTQHSTEPPTPHPPKPSTSQSPCDYSAFDPFHSMTLEPNTNCMISKSGISKEERQEILRVHNTLRDKVARGKENRGDPGPQPSAANMQVLKWNEELEVVAQAWANQCLFDHDTGDGRKICSRDYVVGQNLYYQWGNDPTPNWDRAIQQWYDEVAFMPSTYVDKYEPKASGKDIGHYGQMVWAETRELGCGAVYYVPFMGGTSRVYVCNYGPMGNWLNIPMYQRGPPASACAPGKSSQLYPHLCD